jgi:hypothetical protein
LRTFDKISIVMLAIVCVGLKSWAAGAELQTTVEEVKKETAEKPLDSSCIVLLSGNSSTVVDRTILSASTLYQMPELMVAFESNVQGKITSIIETDHAGDYGLLGGGGGQTFDFGGRIVVGTEKGRVLLLSTKPKDLRAHAPDAHVTRADQIYEEQTISYFQQVSESPITQVAVYFDPLARQDITIASSPKGTHTLKRDGKLMVTHELPLARQSLDMTATREGVIAILPKEIRRYAVLGGSASRIKAETVAKAETEFLAGDTCPNTGVSAVLDGRTVKLIGSFGEISALATLQDGEKFQIMKLSPLGNRLAVKTTKELLLITINADGELTIDTIESTEVFNDMRWSAFGEYLAVSSYQHVTIFNVEKQAGKEFETSPTPELQRMFWLSGDGILATVTAGPLPETTEGPADKKPFGLWTAQFWDAETGEEIPGLTATVPMLQKYEMPPYFVQVSGRLHQGNLKFSLLTEDGRLSQVQQTMKYNITPSTITLPRAARAKLH